MVYCCATILCLTCLLPSTILSWCHSLVEGVVLAVNARILAKNPAPFHPILRDYPQIQLLAWTATGEPPISNSLLDYILEYYRKLGCSNQIGFDCKVRKRRCNAHSLYLLLIGYFFLVEDTFQS